MNVRGNGVFREVLEGLDSFGSAVKFAEAFRRLSRASCTYQICRPRSGARRQRIGDRDRGNLLTRASGSSRPRNKRRFSIGKVFLVLSLLAAGWWWLRAKKDHLSPPGTLASALALVQSSPSATASETIPVKAVPITSDAGIPAVGSITSTPVRRYGPPPFYPTAAKTAHQQGRVLLNADVDAAGNVTGVSVNRVRAFRCSTTRRCRRCVSGNSSRRA